MAFAVYLFMVQFNSLLCVDPYDVQLLCTLVVYMCCVRVLCTRVCVDVLYTVLFFCTPTVLLCLFVFVEVCLCVYTWMHVHIRTYIYVHACIHACTYMYVCVRACMHACTYMYVCVRACMHATMYTHTNRPLHTQTDLHPACNITAVAIYKVSIFALLIPHKF